MRILLFSGDHSRHLYIHKAICENFDIAGVVCVKREEVLPSANPSWPERDRKLFDLHFKARAEIERATFGNLDAKFLQSAGPTLHVPNETIRSAEVAKFIKSVNADVALIFGTPLILEEAMNALPKWRINLHLGLTPWYRGAATLFWPFYFLQPHYAGATIHQIVPEADAGDVIHHVLPELKKGDGIHDVAARCVVQSRDDLVPILRTLSSTGTLPLFPQKSTGRLFLANDFHPSHLRVIYELYENKIVDAYLNGELSKRKPKVNRAF